MSVEGRAAFTAWAAARRPALVRSAFLVTGDHGHAEDLVQQALMKVAVRWERLRGGNPDAYARTVMYRDHISFWRKQSNRAAAPERDVAVAGPDVEHGLVLAQALSRLTPKQRTVLVLRFYDDLSERDTAAALGVSTGTVKSQTSTALRKLRDHAPEVRALLGMEVNGHD